MELKLTRIAPTPSGFLHLGNLYSFLLTKALAEKHQAKILLRIDDLDRDRYRQEYVQDIFDTLDFMEIGYDLGPKTIKEFESEWSQIHRMNSYLDALDKLRDAKVLFACDCTRKRIQQLDSSGYYLGYCLDRRIPLERPETAWRFNTFYTDFIKMKSYPDQEKAYTLPEDGAFFIVRKKDRLPAYQLTSVVDDIHYGVDFIVRGTDLLSSSLDQLVVAEALENKEFSQIIFHHHALLKGPNKTKLSKSEGATSIQFLRNEGKKPKDIYQMIGNLINQEISDFEDFKRTQLP
ncbi:glutamate--tRNA ligase family protein [Algoriphagus pacificus]|uniref:tRNA glutamyl-Q synthetase n=1 Tax=Algoriphagus pacificus TaxID=2811234 RepID=A0ABS3CHH6_9BACT|nr:glutamate--tRNA ligase family protein [Algoriphagus pacificus]MBN7816543.1 tRNA glutamyl-Q synthetase [Algoriphagus pacificus]